MLVRDRSRRRRRGATMVEGAVVLSAFLLIVLGLVVLGLGVYRYQQVAHLAREGARYASVHGGYYARDTGNTAADSSAVYTSAIQPMATAAGLNLSNLTYSVSWDDSSKYPVYLSNAATNTYRNNNVTVTVSYSWLPEAFLGNTARTLSSTSTMPMTY